MADERARYFRRLRRLRRSARRWSVVGAGFAGAAAVLTPYAGLGLPDAAWAAAAGGSLVLAGWRWADLRRVAAIPAPPPQDPAIAAERTRAKLLAALESAPGGRSALAEVRRQRGRFALRGSTAAAGWDRLDRASGTLATLAPRLTGMGGSAALEAAVAEEQLRDLAHRVAGVEKAMRLAPPDAKPGLTEAHRDLTEQLDEGVTAYERLVAAAASYVAEDGRLSGAHPSVSRLTEASDLLRGVASGLAEVRATTPDPIRAAY
ncbi:hypothetical protein O7635_17695 [Asanoa sp. WMMD1127]|uniref:phage shock envelope stress response protein PspM n=1 Tax=Asanoa sp. WMMD1127 TaxID=3016107 RepID=UPI0024166BD2|nr:hypothetical protein [Asanoa sp. WMMD1127]MDG4823692.1 hypothetical protein [Asanoa sp. WMMD1127]